MFIIKSTTQLQTRVSWYSFEGVSYVHYKEYHSTHRLRGQLSTHLRVWVMFIIKSTTQLHEHRGQLILIWGCELCSLLITTQLQTRGQLILIWGCELCSLLSTTQLQTRGQLILIWGCELCSLMSTTQLQTSRSVDTHLRVWVMFIIISTTQLQTRGQLILIWGCELCSL